ncbi:MAG: hypothetical protein EKK53_25275 [Burkholderiales bacterium]|nr:MAG: hypothetical protein EKK53_25275 [Burkholderiales bacterium]
MSMEVAPVAGAGGDAAHWIEVIDGQGCFPSRRLGPYASASQAARACRGVMRLLNPARYQAVVRTQGEPAGPG